MNRIAIAGEQRPFIDLVQIRCADSFGTGLLVRDGIILTALHCVADPTQNWLNRQPIGIYLWRDLYKGKEYQYSARVAWPIDRCSETDLAVLVITNEDIPQSMLFYTYRELPVSSIAVTARGFPRATAGHQLPGGRIECAIPGQASFTGATIPTITFTSMNATHLSGKDAWAGLSGAPVVEGESVLVGVMRDVPEAWDGARTLGVQPLATLLNRTTNVELRRLLNANLPLSSNATPAPDAIGVDPDYQRLWDYLYTLNRDDELREAVGAIRAHTGKRPIEILVRGDPEDVCEEFFKRLWRDHLAPSAGRSRTIPPPLPIRWPHPGRRLNAACLDLAARALSSIGHEADWQDDLITLQSKLQDAPSPCWICIRLPDKLDSSDISLLRRWREVWSDLVRNDEQPSGYVLLLGASVKMPSAFKRAKEGSVMGGLGVADVTLREISSDDLNRWQQQIEHL